MRPTIPCPICGHFVVTESRSRLLTDALAALRPFARFAERFNAKPISQLHDSFYAIHTGTEWEAELRLSDLRAALELVQRAAEAGMGGEEKA